MILEILLERSGHIHTTESQTVGEITAAAAVGGAGLTVQTKADWIMFLSTVIFLNYTRAKGF
jgi:hypothetical protein